jgi:PadR family transcriptional regulator AphA
MATALSTTEYAVLGLASQGELSGYDMDRRAQRSIALFWRPAKSKIYAALPGLEREGLVTSRVVRQVGRPDKTLYRITSRGDEVLRQWIVEPGSAGGAGRDTLLLKVFFARDEEAAAVEAMIRGRRERAVERLALLEEIEQRALRDPDDDDFYKILTLMHGLEDVRSTIAWADRALAALEQRWTRTEARGARR